MHSFLLSRGNVGNDIQRRIKGDEAFQINPYLCTGDSLYYSNEQRYGSYDSYESSYESNSPAVVNLNQNYNAYNEYWPAAEYSSSTMTRQQALPYDQSPGGIWWHTCQVPTFRPRGSNPMKRRRSRSHLDDVFLANHDEDEVYKKSRPEAIRKRCADSRRNLRQISREDDISTNSTEDREGAKRFCDKELKKGRNDPRRKTLIRNATKDIKQSTVNNDRDKSKSSIPSEKYAKTSTDVQHNEKSDKSAIILNDTPNNDVFNSIVTTKSYLAEYGFDNDSCDSPNLSVIDMEISSRESTPKRRKIDGSCVDCGKETIEPQHTPERNNVMKKTEEVKQAKSSQDELTNAANIKGSKESQNIPERNSVMNKSEEVKKAESYENKLKSALNIGLTSDGNPETKSRNQKIESEMKIVGGDNKVDMLYKRTESKEGLSYRMNPGYTIPKKTQIPQPSRKNVFSDINDVYSTEVRKLFEDPNDTSKIKIKDQYKSISPKSTDDGRNSDMKSSFNSNSKTSSIHRYSNQYKPYQYTSKPENVRLGTDSKVSNFRKNLDSSRSLTDPASIDTNVPLNISSSNNVPKKISFRRYSDNRRSLYTSKSENSRSPLSPFRFPIDTSYSKNTNCSRSDTFSKPWNTDHSISSTESSSSVDRRESIDIKNHSSQSPDNSKLYQNVPRSDNVKKNSVVKSDAPSCYRTLFKNSNQIRLGDDARGGDVRSDSYSNLKSDCVDAKDRNGTRRYFNGKPSGNCKAKPPYNRYNVKRKEVGSDKSIRTAGVVFDNRYNSISDNSRDVEYESSSQDSSPNAHSMKNREIKPSKHSGTEFFDETDCSRDSSYQKEEQSKSKNVSSSSRTSSDLESTNLKQMSDGHNKASKIRSIDTERCSQDSKVERSKFKRKIKPNAATTPVRKKEKQDNRNNPTTLLNDTRKQTSSDVQKPTKTNNMKYKETVENVEVKGRSGQPNGSGLTAKEGMGNAATELIVVIEKECSRKCSSLNKTPSATTSNTNELINVLDDFKVQTSALSSSEQVSSDKKNLHIEIKSDIYTNVNVSSTSHRVGSEGYLKDVDSSNPLAIESKDIKRKNQNDSISNDATNQNCDGQYFVCKNDVTDRTTNEVATQNSLATDVRMVVDPLEEAVKSVLNGKVVSEDIFTSLRKISASNKGGNKLGSSNEFEDTSVPLNQDSAEKTSATRHDENNIPPINEKSVMCVNNIGKLVDGNNTLLTKTEEKSEGNYSSAIKIPVDMKSHVVSSISYDMHTKDNLGNIEKLFDGKNTVLVPVSDLNIQVVESKMCDAEVSTVKICKPLSMKIHKVSSTHIEAEICLPLPEFQFELDSASTSFIESTNYGTVNILKPVEIIECSIYVFDKTNLINLEEQDIPIVDLVDDKQNISIIDLTEEAEMKEEVRKDDATDIYDILVEATDSSEQITLYRSDETVNDNLDVQATSVSISSLKGGSYEQKKELDVDDEVKKEEESEEPDSIFTEIELLNICKKDAKPKEVKMEVDQPAAAEDVHIKDENAGKIPTETSEKEKETQTVAQTEEIAVQNAIDVLTTDSVVLGNKSTCSDKNTSSSDNDRGQLNNALDMPKLDHLVHETTNHSNKDCTTASTVAEYRHDKPDHGNVVDDTDQMIRNEEIQARNEISSKPNESATESGEEDSALAEQSLSIPAPTSRATILQNEVLCPPVTYQQASCEVSTSSRIDNAFQRANVAQSLRKDGLTETQPPNIIQTQDSLQQHDIWNVTGVLLKYLIRMHCLKACCFNYDKTLALYKLIDPALYHVESKLMPLVHEKRLSIYAAAMKGTFEHYNFRLPLIPEDVLKVTYNRVKKSIPQLDMRWIIFALLSLMKEEPTYYYTHVSLKYLYMYITSASIQLSALNRQDQVRQQQPHQQGQQQQYLAPDQLCLLKNQIQQFNNICGAQQWLLNPKPQKAKQTTQKKRNSKQSSDNTNSKASTTNENSKIQSLHSSPAYAQSTSSRLQDSNNNSTKVAFANKQKLLSQLLQGIPPASSLAQPFSRIEAGTINSPTHITSACNPSPNMSPAHGSTPMIRLKDPSSLMRGVPETPQSTSNMNNLERLIDNFPYDNASNSARQKTSAGNLNNPGCSPRTVHMPSTFGLMSPAINQLSNLTWNIGSKNNQHHVYAPRKELPPPAPNHSTVPSQSVLSSVPASSARQHGVMSSAQQLSNLTRTIQTTNAPPEFTPFGFTMPSPQHQISDLSGTTESRKKYSYLPRPFQPPPAYKSPNHGIVSGQGVPGSLYSVMSSPAQQLSDQMITVDNNTSYMSPAQISSPAHGFSDRTESTSRRVYAATALPNMSFAQSGVTDQNLQSVAHISAISSPARRISDTAEESTSRGVYSSTALPNVHIHATPVQSEGSNPNRQSVAMSPAHVSAMPSPAHQTSDKDKSISRNVDANVLLRILLGRSSAAQSEASNRWPTHSSEMSGTLDQNGSIAASISRNLAFMSSQSIEVQTTNSSIHSPRISSNNSIQSNPIVGSPAHQFGTTQTSGQTVDAGFSSSAVHAPRISPNQSVESARTCFATSSANNVQPAQIGVSVYTGTTSDSPASTPRISPNAPTGSLTTNYSAFSNNDNGVTQCEEISMSASPAMSLTSANATPHVANTPASLRMHLDDIEGPDITPVYAPLLFPRTYDQPTTPTPSSSPVSHISDGVEVIDLTWIDDLDEERLEMEVDEMVKKEELEDDEEVIINNIEHFAVINDSQKYPPDL